MAEQRSGRVAFGLPTINAEAHLAEAIESLLAQTRTDFSVTVVDDCSDDRTLELALRYAELDQRVKVHAGSARLGLVGNWRRALHCALQASPRADYFAWASDHDIWHDEWLEALVAELDAYPQAVLAYPLTLRISETGADVGRQPWVADTAGRDDRSDRLRTVIHQVKPGDAIYGLMRVEPLLRSGQLPLVVSPDRLLLTRLAVEGEFRQVPRLLWSRRYRQGVHASAARQRRSFYPNRVPLLAYVPWPIAHGVLFRRRERTGTSLRDVEGSEGLAQLHFQETMRFAAADWRERRLRASRRRRKRWRKRLARSSRLRRVVPGPIRRLARPFVRLGGRASGSDAIQ